MAYTVDFNTVSTVGLESSPVADALAGLRANEARYFKNKYDHDFTVEPATAAKPIIQWVHRILKDERGIVIASRRGHASIETFPFSRLLISTLRGFARSAIGISKVSTPSS